MIKRFVIGNIWDLVLGIWDFVILLKHLHSQIHLFVGPTVAGKKQERVEKTKSVDFISDILIFCPYQLPQPPFSKETFALLEFPLK